MSFLILVCVFIGFAPTYFLAGGFRAHLPNVIIHYHAAVFSSWILFLVLQTSLVSAHRVDLHRRIGMLGFALACLMVILGSLAGVDLLVRNVAPAGINPRAFYIVPFSEMVMFAVLVFLAYRTRRDPPSHKRFMLTATTALLGVAFTRFHVLFLYRKFWPALLASYSFLLLLALYDLWSEHRLHRATIMGSAVVIGVGLVRLPLAQTPAWQSFAWWLQSHAQRLG